MSINKVILLGNVGKDPEVKYLDNNLAFCRFPLATSENYTNKSGEKVSNTEWHNITMWRRLAEIAEKYVKKGDQLYIEGRIRSRAYDDKDGNKRYVTEIVADNMQLLSKRGTSTDGKEEISAGAAIENNYTQPESVENISPAADDLPF